MGDLIHNEEDRRYSLHIDGYETYVEYHVDNGVYVLAHTFVPEELRGKGAGAKLLLAVLDELRSEGARIIPECPFIVTYIKRNPQYKDMVVE